jgi:hypothetical protein
MDESLLVCVDPLLMMMHRSAPLWNRFVGDSGAVNGFFGLHLTFLRWRPEADPALRVTK